MKTVIRVDASDEIGSGHLMRCLTLAQALKDYGISVAFICRELPGNLCDYLEEKEFRVYRLPKNAIKNNIQNNKNIGSHAHWLGVKLEDDIKQTLKILNTDKAGFDWLIVDHYALGEAWEGHMRNYVKKIMVIDDLADRKHDCDLLLDQNLYKNFETRYDELVPSKCQKLLGSKYALLRSEFVEARKNLRKRNGKIKRILVSFGGYDITNETEKTLKAIQLLERPDLVKDIVVGALNPKKEKVKDLCDTMPNTYYQLQVDNMAELITKSDLAIGAGGATTWERSCLGLPSLIISVSFNQEAISEVYCETGAGKYLGVSNNVSKEHIYQNIKKLLKGSQRVKKMGDVAYSLVDGIGTFRILRQIKNGFIGYKN